MRWSVRSVYFYLVSLIMLLTVVFGSVALVNAVIDLFEPGYDSYYRGPVDPSREAYLRAELARTYPELSEEEIRQMAAEQLQEEMRLGLQRETYWRIRRLVQSAMLILVAFPVYRYHWRRANEPVPDQ